jgi:hypothetical protein
MNLIRRLVIPAAITVAAIASMQAGARAAMPSTTNWGVQVHVVVASPDTDSGCTYGSSDGNTKTCFKIVGKGQKVDYMTMSSCVYHTGRYLHQEYTGPRSEHFKPPYNTAQILIHPGQCLDSKLTINADVAVGTYHGITWRWNGDHSWTNIGEVNLPVSR